MIQVSDAIGAELARLVPLLEDLSHSRALSGVSAARGKRLRRNQAEEISRTLNGKRSRISFEIDLSDFQEALQALTAQRDLVLRQCELRRRQVLELHELFTVLRGGPVTQ